MSQTLWVLAVAWIALLTGFSGCLQEKETAYHVYASNGHFAIGWAYAGGAEAVPFNGPAFVDVNDEANTGMVMVKGKIGDQDVEIMFDHFMQSKPFHDGGVAANFREHGASGVGDMSIPEVTLDMAGWGHATFKMGNAVVKDPVTGADVWAAHFMVIENGVRDDTKFGIYADANKTKPYDPKAPANGTTVEGDWELHVVLKNETGNASAPLTIAPIANGMANPTYSQNHNLFMATFLGATANIAVNLTSTGASSSNVTVTIKSPSGQPVVARGIGPGMVPVSPTTMQYTWLASFPVKELGQYTVTVAGRLSPGGTYNIRGLVVPPPTVVYNFWWEDLLFGAEAEAKADAEGLHVHPDGGSMTPMR